MTQHPLPHRQITKSLCIFLLACAGAAAQPFSWGIKGGLPMNNFIDTVNTGLGSASTTTNRYIVGPTAELRLPFGLGVEFDVLYRHFNYSSSGTLSSLAGNFSNATTGNAWEFPLLAKYRFKGPIIHPFVDAGVSWDKLSGLTQTATNVIKNVTSTTSTGNPLELSNSTTRGFVVGGGIDVKILILHITPEVRFTRWGDKHFIDPQGLLHSNLSQAEFLVGFTF
jgi:opacity protein-like surface antigen